MNERLGAVAPAVPGGASQPSPVDALTAGLLRQWWLGTRPAWTDPGWYEAPLRPAVRALLRLQLGPGLLSALSALETAEPGRHVRCPGDHRGEGLPGLPVPGSAPGYACACQVVVAAGWEAMSS